MQCGAINDAEARICCLCDTRLSANSNAISLPAREQLSGNGGAAVETDWRTQVAERLEAYRVRQGYSRKDGSQEELAFAPLSLETAPSEAHSDVRGFEAPPANITKRRFRPARVERVEIDVEQPSFNFAKGHHVGAKMAISRYDSPALAVAPLIERRRAGALDLAFLLFSYGGFLMLFGACGGRFSLSRFDLLVNVATLGLLYAQYVTLFTYFAGATPGMMLRSLRVAGLDGLDPSPRQLLWRSFGYLISAGTLMLGFLWALWDEDQLSWHDRISQTCVTPDLALAGEAL